MRALFAGLFCLIAVWCAPQETRAQAIVLPCVPSGTSCIPVSAANPLPTTGGAVISGATPCTGCASGGVLFSNGGVVTADSGFTYAGSGGQLQLNGNGILTSPAAATWQFGAANVNGVPIAQTIRMQSALAGSATNQASATTTIIGSLGTGTGTNGDIIFQTGVKTTTGTVQAAPTTAFTIKGESQNVVFAAGFQTASDGTFGNANSNRAIMIANPVTATVPGFIPLRSDTTTGIGAQASGNMSMIVGGAEIGRFIAGGFTLISGQLNVTSMTQTAVAQSGTVCYNSGTGAVTYDATLGCLTSTMEAKDDWQTITPHDALARVVQFEAGSFTYKKGLGLPEGPQVGLNAQQIASIDDRLVGRSLDGVLRGVRYQQASALYGPAIRAISDDVAAMRAELNEIKSHVH